MRLALALLSVTTMVAFAVPARGEPGLDEGVANAAFLGSLRTAGITFSNADQAIAAGRTVCGLIANGESGLEVLKDLKTTNPGFTTDGAAQFAAIAAKSYCPQQLTTDATGSAE